MSAFIPIVSFFMALAALLFGLAVRVLATLRFADFSGDQIRDAYVSMNMWQGTLPTLGPSSAWGDIYLPPLYFYLTFPFTVFGADLAFQAIANAILTFLSIPLLIFTIYQLLENVPPSKRLLIASGAGLWYSLIFQNIIINTGNSLAGNSGSIVFFLLAFVLLFKYQWEAKLSMQGQIVCWILYGMTLALIGNLHFAPLFVMSAVFVGSIIAFCLKNRRRPKRWALPLLSIGSGVVMMTPYWIGEFSRGWTNTQGIISLIFKASNEDGYAVTFLQRLQAIASGYFSLGTDVYFFHQSTKSLLLSFFFLGMILTISLWKFKGNRPIFYLFLSIWALFLYAYSSTDMERTYDPVFYKLLIFFAPIILTSISLAYFNYRKTLEKIVILTLIATVSLSAVINLDLHKNYVYSRYGPQRIAHTADYIKTVKALPAGSTLCDINSHRPSIRIYEYTNEYIVKKPLSFNVDCEPDSYAIYPKFKSSSRFEAVPSKAFASYEKPHEVFYEDDVFYIFRLL